MASVQSTADVKQQNGLQLNRDMSEALIVSTVNQLCVVDSSSPSVSVTGVDLPVAEDMKVLEMLSLIDRRLTFHKHVSTLARSCSYHVQAIRHIRNPLSTELAQTLACIAWSCPGSTTATLCSMARRPAPSRNCSEFKTQCSSDCAPGLEAIPCQAVTAPAALIVQQRITYKLAVLTYKVRNTSTPVCADRITERVCSRTIYVHLASRCMLVQPFTITDFSMRVFWVFSTVSVRLSGTRCYK